jgi:hypothetical protein
MFRPLAASLAICFSTCAFGAGTVTAKVIEVRVDKSGKGIVTFAQPLAGQAASCRNPSYNQSLAFDANAAGGRAILALVLSAKATGETVTALSTGDCSIYNNNWVEDWDYGSIA